MKKYLSHGMGVNSTALMLLLLDEGIEFESVFVNHGGDYPQTYKYCAYLQKHNYKITTIAPDYRGCNTIEEYCYAHNLFPGFKFRWCTVNFKIIPLHQYYDKPCIDYVGISFEERKRIVNHKHTEGIDVQYPLIKKMITRGGCIDIIKAHRLEVPQRSGCWCCPFMRVREVRRLYLEDNNLYQKRKRLEKNVIFKKKKPLPISVRGVNVDEEAMENVPPITSYL